MNHRNNIQQNYISELPHALRLLVTAFLVVLSIGYYSAISFVNQTTDASPQGIHEQYLGNEFNPDSETMKFEKGLYDMLNIVHAHVLSLSLIFLVLGFLIYGIQLNPIWKKFLMIEPFVSIVLTFGGLFLMWTGLYFMVYVVMISGFVLSFCFGFSVLLILRDCWCR